MKTKNLVITIGLILIIGILGYFGYTIYGSKNYQSQTSTQTPKENEISISDFSFNPEELTVETGTEITFTNNDSSTHTVTFDSFDSGSLKPGQSFKHTFNEKGTFEYYCSLHPSMKGKVIIK